MGKNIKRPPTRGEDARTMAKRKGGYNNSNNSGGGGGEFSLEAFEQMLKSAHASRSNLLAERDRARDRVAMIDRMLAMIGGGNGGGGGTVAPTSATSPSYPFANPSAPTGKRRGRPPGSGRKGLFGSGSGGDGGGGRGRPRNESSLADAIRTVLAKAPDEGMGVAEIMEGVRSAGYSSSSANFRGIVNQTLIKEKKQFERRARGKYGVRAGAAEPAEA